MKQVRLPFSFLFSLVVITFMLGTMTGSVITYLLLYLNPPSQQESTKENNQENIVYTKSAVLDKILDGDTIYVKIDGKQRKVRLLGIDAPEDKNNNKSFYGKEALEAIKRLIKNKKLTLVWHSKDQKADYRLLAYVYAGKKFVNAELIKDGYASVYRRRVNFEDHAHYSLFYKLEQQARANQLGIWNIKNKIRWERQQGLSSPIKPSMYIADNYVFHRPNCPKVKDIKFKRYYYKRNNAIRDNRAPCKICKP